jgi:hypothetical protein
LNPIRAVVGIPNRRFNLFVKCSSLDEIKDQRNQGPGVSDGAMWSLPIVLMPEPQASPIVEKRGPGRPRKDEAA